MSAQTAMQHAARPVGCDHRHMPSKDNGTAETTHTQGDATNRQQMPRFQSTPIRVLHVDDSPKLIETGRRHLERYDDRIEVISARSATEGITLLADNPVDCIISDYSMPGTNGIEFLRTVREEWTKLPFILYTSNQSEAMVTEALCAGATDCIQKQSGTAHLDLLGQKIVTTVEARRLSQTHGQLFKAIDAIEVGIGVLNRHDQVVYANDSLLGYLETDEQGLRGTDLAGLYQKIPPAHRENGISVDDAGLRGTILHAEGNRFEMGRHVLVSIATDGVDPPSSGTEQNSVGTGDDDDT